MRFAKKKTYEKKHNKIITHLLVMEN